MSGSEVLGAVLGAEMGGWEEVVRVGVAGCCCVSGRRGGRGGEGEERGRVVVTLTQWISFILFSFLGE